MLKINKLPAMAGMIRLMNQMPAVAKIIPAVLVLNNPVSNIPILPLNPNSAMAKVGITAITKNDTLTDQKPCHHKSCTSNKRNSR